MKKRFAALILIFSIIASISLSLVSCGEKYEPVESTAEEKRTVMTISYDGEKYKVPYELYRAFFLQLKPVVDGGNADVWTGENKDEYVTRIDEMILHRISEIYAVFHLCEKADIDVYSTDFENQIKEHLEIAVEGGMLNNTVYEGFDGNYDKYLASLKEMNLNYSTQVLLLRYQIAYETLASHYIGDLSDDSLKVGDIEYTKDDVREFYLDEDASVRVILAQLDNTYFTKERALAIRNTIASKTSDTDVANYIAGFTLSSPTSEVIGKYTYDEFYYSELTESVFSLDVGETGEVITLKTDVFDGYVIAYRVESTESFFDNNYEEIKESYLYDVFGRAVATARDGIASAATATDELKELDRSSVKMG